MIAPHLTAAEVAAAIRSAPADSPLAELSRRMIRYFGLLDDHRAGGDPYRSAGLGHALDRAEWDVRQALGLQSADDDEREPLPLVDLLREARGVLQPDRATQQRVWRRLQAAQSASLPWWRRAWRRITRRRHP